ncbi:MAG: hypothetical protein AAFQ20_07060 [Bacteroidota bacterium]
MGTEEILEYLENLEAESMLQVNGNTYTWEQVKLAKKINSDIKRELGFATSKPELSRRRAYIVVLEERYYDVPEYPKEVTLANIHKRAAQRFTFAQRGMKGFETVSEVHPKRPCTFYENTPFKKMNYRRALSHLVQFQNLFFEIEEAAESLKTTYREILLC